MRWKVFHFMNPTEPTTKETFGFKTTKSPPMVKDLDAFEDKMLALIQNVQFKKVNSDFQQVLLQDAKKIRNDTKLLIPADKTTNFYRLDTESYNKLLTIGITSYIPRTFIHLIFQS